MYDAQGNLASFTGYDGYMQTYAYGLFGVRTEKREKGNPERVTLEGLLGGKRLARIEEGGDVADTDEWVKTRYIQDVTQAYAQVLVEIGEESRTAYAYGLERLSTVETGTEGTLKTTYGYVYDGRGSVAQVVGDDAVTSMQYTAFGMPIGEGASVSGYGYNGEMYDAATGMVHLRARQYEPAMNRFSQKDVLRGTVETPLSLNRYAFVVNDPVNYADPSGLVPSAAIAAAEAAKSSKATSKGYADTGGYENQTKPSTVSAKNATTVDYPVNSSASYAYSGPTTTTMTPPSNSTYTFLPATQRYGTTNSNSPLTGLVKSSNEVKKKAAEAYLTQQAQNAVTEAQRNAYQAAAAEVKNLNPNKAADLVKINQIVQAACGGELGKKKEETPNTATLPPLLSIEEYIKIAYSGTYPAYETWDGQKIGPAGKDSIAYGELSHILDLIYAMRGESIPDLGPDTSMLKWILGGKVAVEWELAKQAAEANAGKIPYAVDIRDLFSVSFDIETWTEIMRAVLNIVEDSKDATAGSGSSSTASGSGSSSSGGDTPTPPKDEPPQDPTPTQQPSIPEKDIASLSQNVQDIYARYDKAGWKGNVSGQAPGTAAGRKYLNTNDALPSVSENGTPVNYFEFDVNNLVPGAGRDSERFVYGSDGSVYYTDSHYGDGVSPTGLPPFVKIK